MERHLLHTQAFVPMCQELLSRNSTATAGQVNKQMTCCPGRKHQNSVHTFLGNIQFLDISMFQWTMTKSAILEDVILVKSVIWKNTVTH